MAIPSHPDLEYATSPTSLIELVPQDIGSVVIGFEPESEHLAIHLAPLPDDERCAAAGLFGMRAEPSWCAVAVVISGRARHLITGEMIGPAVARLVVSRDARVASDLVVDGRPVEAMGTSASIHGFECRDAPDGSDGRGRSVDLGRPDGLVVDAAHRMLGIASPGTPPPAIAVALAVWSHSLLARTLESGGCTWSEAVALHPGHPTHSRRSEPSLDVSIEMVVEATSRLAADLDWSRMHRRAAGGRSVPPDLTVDEVAWMDSTLYGRWLLGSMPHPRTTVAALRAQGCDDAARKVEQVIDAVERSEAALRCDGSDPMTDQP